MAVVSKFQVRQRILCMRCNQSRDVIARTAEWTGQIRTALHCTTPECSQIFPNTKGTKGNVSLCLDVRLVDLPNGDQVVLEDYECSNENAERFCQLFTSVLDQIPSSARQRLLLHWQTGCGSPHVWLLKNRKEWGGSGWAACSNDGLSMYVVSTLIGQVPDEHIKLAIAHELGHMLFNSGNETFHVAARPKSIVYSSGSFSEQVIPNSQPDPFRFHRPEWLVWRLMESWGFDQIAAEVWMERNVIDDESGIRFREESLPDEGSEANCIRIRKEIEGKLSDMEFPAEFEQYLTSRDEMKA